MTHELDKLYEHINDIEIAMSVAASHFEIAVTRLQGRTVLTLRGPETKATTVDCPADGEWLGIRFKLGTFIPRVPPGQLLDRNDVTLPGASSRSFWLDGSAWEYPSFENAETFVARLIQKGIITRDPAVDAVVGGQPPPQSLRSVQRHFLHAAFVVAPAGAAEHGHLRRHLDVRRAASDRDDARNQQRRCCPRSCRRD